MSPRQSKILWFTGLSGSGKTTIAGELKKRLEARGKRVHIVDADEVRASYQKPLGFSREDIRENNRRHALIAQEKLKDNDFVIVAIVSPFIADRALVREMLGESFILIYANAALETVIKRDTMGLYSKALRGEKDDVIGMTGSKIPYEPPLDADIKVRTDQSSLEECVEKILKIIT